jgi:hypothetical protein
MTAPVAPYSSRYPIFRLVLLILAVICFVIFAVIGFGWVTVHGSHPDGFGFLGLGLALGFAALI